MMPQNILTIAYMCMEKTNTGNKTGDGQVVKEATFSSFVERTGGANLLTSGGNNF